jgi:DNA-binding response OmpR family regulator
VERRVEQLPLILLAEDDALIALTLQAALEEASFAVHHVFDADDAIQALEAKHRELSGVITDINFGRGVDGWAIGRRARELIPQFPVVYISGDSAHEHTVKGVPESIMLQKPFTPAQMVTELSTLLNAKPLAPQQPG